jgi:hypothetical protein
MRRQGLVRVSIEGHRNPLVKILVMQRADVTEEKFGKMVKCIWEP